MWTTATRKTWREGEQSHLVLPALLQLVGDLKCPFGIFIPCEVGTVQVWLAYKMQQSRSYKKMM